MCRAASCTDPLLRRPAAQPGDKIVKISASFGEEVWDAQNFGQVRRTRWAGWLAAAALRCCRVVATCPGPDMQLHDSQ
jgi:hypothetical protein